MDSAGEEVKSLKEGVDRSKMGVVAVELLVPTEWAKRGVGGLEKPPMLCGLRLEEPVTEARVRGVSCRGVLRGRPIFLGAGKTQS